MPGFPRTTCVASIALLLLVACAAAPGEPDAGGVTVSVDGTTLVYRGPLHRQGVAALRQAAAGAPETPRALVITSTGGDVEAGMELGTWVFEHRLDVHVPEYCISSCANYVFTAGRNKVLGPSALVIWHGGTTQEGLASASPCDYLDTPDVPCDEQKLRQVLEDTLTRVQELEADFFARVGVTQLITVLGQWPQYDCRPGADRHGYIGWYYSIADLEKLGVNNVSVAGGDWKPATRSPGIKFCRVIL
ncbi:MAG TPA: hypothetical protein VKZ85_11090 [Woeseiaceae bacterium]|nr:hypothetical protein [Woeseiaceae bacterium]